MGPVEAGIEGGAGVEAEIDAGVEAGVEVEIVADIKAGVEAGIEAEIVADIKEGVEAVIGARVQTDADHENLGCQWRSGEGVPARNRTLGPGVLPRHYELADATSCTTTAQISYGRRCVS